ncbi:MAG: hypothetical protein KGI54_17510 [Pseudomonadota bacterium]|nr:hypothetical protein [Pseudomonadota bacterium]
MDMSVADDLTNEDAGLDEFRAYKNLATAVLACAIKDSRTSWKNLACKRARIYLLGGGEDHVFSVENICALLNLDHARLCIWVRSLRG